MVLQSNNNILVIEVEVDILTLRLQPSNPARTCRTDMLNAQLHIPLFNILKLYQGHDFWREIIAHPRLAVQRKILARIVLEIKACHSGTNPKIWL